MGLFGNIQDFEPYEKEISHEYFMELMAKSNIKMNLELASYIKDSSRKHDLISQIQNYEERIIWNKNYAIK